MLALIILQQQNGQTILLIIIFKGLCSEFFPVLLSTTALL